MGIHIIDDDKMVECNRAGVKKEEEIEDFLEAHPAVLDKDIFIIGRQVPTETKGRIDLMGMSMDGNLVIIEIKRGTSTRDVVSQILEYGVWAAELRYEDLNRIAKVKHLVGYPNLFKKFEEKFGSVPEPFNVDQRLYIVAERIDEKIKDVAQYLHLHNVQIACVELNFYQNDKQRLVHTSLVVGEEATSEVDDKKNVPISSWKEKINAANPQNRDTVLDLISKIEQRLGVKGHPQSYWYFIRIKERDKKNLFCSIMCSKSTAHISFRVDPEAFEYENDPEVRIAKLWFFNTYERKIAIKDSNVGLILKCLDHAYKATVNL